MRRNSSNSSGAASSSHNSKKRVREEEKGPITYDEQGYGAREVKKKATTSNFPSNGQIRSPTPSPTPMQIVRTSGVGLPQVLTKGAVSKREAYIDKFKKLLELELKEDLKEVEMRRRKWSRERLQREGFSVFDLKGTSSGTTMNGEAILRFRSTDDSALPYHQFQPGDVVVLRTKNGFQVTLANGTRARKDYTDAVVVDVDNYTVLVTVAEAPIEVNRLSWQLDKGTNRIAYDRMLEALNSFAKSSLAVQTSYDVSGIPPRYHPPAQPLTALKSIILDDNSKAASTAALPSILDPLHNPLHFPRDFSQWKLNESQRSTINKCLHRKLSLIQGPPGTGKTTTVVQLINLLCHLYKGSGITILACAYTNVATDNLLEGCLDFGLRALRLGRPVKVRPELRKATLESQVESHHLKEHLEILRLELQKQNVGSLAYKSLRDQIQSTERLIVNEVMKSAQVICSTCIYAGDPMLRGVYFPVVIIDECTQATEPASLVPIVAGGAQQVILVGDHHQLPPTVKSDAASKGGLADSLFSRLIKESKLEVFLLNTQYRMHPFIAEFPSKHFYSNKLLNGVDEASRPLVPGFAWPNNLPVAFWNMPRSREERGGSSGDSKSWVNRVEVVHLVDVVKSLLDTHLVAPQSIGIVTPYSAQVKLIFKYLKDALKDYEFEGDQTPDFDDSMADFRGHGYKGITVSSVDGFQGREKDIILFSAVRSNSAKRLGFLKDWRRLNVALTRARRGVIVFGDGEVLSTDPHWKAWIDWVTEAGAMKVLQPPSKDHLPFAAASSAPHAPLPPVEHAIAREPPIEVDDPIVYGEPTAAPSMEIVDLT
jgi:regulator of nonsense transcripts 1